MINDKIPFTMILLVTVLGGHFYIKIDITIIFTSLITNPLLSLFLPFIETKKKKSGSWWSGSEKYLCVLLIASRTLFQMYGYSIKFYKAAILYVIPYRKIVL